MGKNGEVAVLSFPVDKDKCPFKGEIDCISCLSRACILNDEEDWCEDLEEHQEQ